MKKNWEVKKLEEICNFGNGLWAGKKPPYIEVGVIRNTNFTKDCELDDTNIVFLNVEQSQFAKRKLVFGDIILEKSGGGPKQPIGRVIIFNKKDGDFSFSNFTSVIRIRDNIKVDFKYLHKYLYFFYISGATESMQSHSTGIRNLKFDQYKQILVSLPTLSEQKRIVEILDEALAAIAKVKENDEKNLQNARELFESYMHSVFANLGDGWEVKKLGEVTHVTRGHNPPKSQFSPVPKEGYVRFYQIRDGWADDYTVYVPDSPKLHKVTSEDILMVAYRHIGKAFRGVTGAFNVALCKITNVRKDLLDDEYLFQIIQSTYVRGELLKRSERSLIPSMSIEHLKEILFPVPPLHEQRSIVGKLDALSAETKKLEAIYQRKLADLEELKKSILQKAFNGELTGG